MSHLLKITLLLLIAGSAYASAPSFKDTFFHRQWGVINTGQTIQRTTGETSRTDVKGISGADINYLHLKEEELPKDREVIVAVLDSGVDIHHPDLKGRIWSSKECRPSAQREDFIIECAGFDFLDRKSSVKDDVGHGTHVAGLIAANANDIGIAGIAPKNIKIMPVKILNNKARDFVYDRKLITDIFADGISFARRHGADVINLSLGWPKIVQSKKITKEIRLAQEAGILIVAAAGNNNKNVPVFPCTNEGVLCVGAVDNQGKITEFTNYGGKIDLLAPGEGIISTYPMNKESRTLRVTGYEKKKGSSQAAPYISGIAAVIKLMHPEATVDEMKARLYHSARDLKEAKRANKDAKCGLVDMEKAVREKPSQFFTPNFKNILGLEYEVESGGFGFNLPIKSLVGKASDLEISLSFDNPSIVLKQNVLTIPSIDEGELVNNFIQGHISNLRADANAVLRVTIKSKEGFEKTTSTMVSFSRKLKDEDLKTFPVKDVDARLISYFKGKRKVSRLSPVIDTHLRAKAPEFVYQHPKKQTDDKTVISLLRREGEEFVSKDIEIEKVSTFLKLYRVDANLDGKDDYMLYSLSKDEENLILDFVDENLNPLYKEKSRWRFPISTFEGLPTRKDEIPFQWIKLKSENLGDILVPAITREWFMPEEDNSNDILNVFVGRARHIYYLNPTFEEEEVLVKLRVLDSASVYSELVEKTEAMFDEKIEIQPPFFQTKDQADRGSLTSLVAVGKEFVRRYFLLTITSPGEYSLVPTSFGGRFLSENGVFPVVDAETGKQSNESLFMARFDKKRARTSFLGLSGETQVDTDFESSSWSDPVFTFIGAFKKGAERIQFLESRYHVWALTGDGQKKKLPINRDSAFPGVQFAETLDTLVIASDQGNQAGIYINSTLIFGDRLFTMTMENGEFIRPMSLSVKIPHNCTQLAPSQLNNQALSSYTLLCVEPGNKASIKFFPLSL